MTDIIKIVIEAGPELVRWMRPTVTKVTIDRDDLRANLAENCVPEEFMEMDIFNYQVFLDMRRRMMAQYIREFYESLV